MIKSSVKLFLAILTTTVFHSYGQSLTTIEEVLNTVEAAKATYRQNMKQLDDGLVQYSVVEVDSKGKETETMYRFSLSDIDDNTVRSMTKKDIITVQLLVEAKQKLIQKITDGGDKISYESELEFMATNAENGSQLEKAIIALIPGAVAYDQKRLSLRGLL